MIGDDFKTISIKSQIVKLVKVRELKMDREGGLKVNFFPPKHTLYLTFTSFNSRWMSTYC